MKLIKLLATAAVLRRFYEWLRKLRFWNYGK